MWIKGSARNRGQIVYCYLSWQKNGSPHIIIFMFHSFYHDKSFQQRTSWDWTFNWVQKMSFIWYFHYIPLHVSMTLTTFHYCQWIETISARKKIFRLTSNSHHILEGNTLLWSWEGNTLLWSSEGNTLLWSWEGNILLWSWEGNILLWSWSVIMDNKISKTSFKTAYFGMQKCTC